MGLLLGSAGCGEFFLGEDPDDTPETNFDVFWQDVDLRYGLFEEKNTNWDSLYAVYRPLVTPATDASSLFETLCSLLFNLNDGHVTLKAPFGTCVGNQRLQVQWPTDDYKADLVELSVRPMSKAAGGRLRYGRWLDPRFGYIRIESFSGGDAPVAGWVEALDDILDSFRDTDGLVIDVRSNPGGNGFNARAMAGRFTTVRTPFIVTQTRDGPSHGDFTAPTTWYVEPAGRVSYDKPVVLLTNRYTFSAAEWFVLAMRGLPRVTTAGSRTGGGLSSRIHRGLPNGWTYTLSIQKTRAADGRSYEAFGIGPELFLNASNIINNDIVLTDAFAYLIQVTQ
jgi:hypothetical protein